MIGYKNNAIGNITEGIQNIELDENDYKTGYGIGHDNIDKIMVDSILLASNNYKALLFAEMYQH